MLIRVCDKCRCELSNAAPYVTVRVAGEHIQFDLCGACLAIVFADLGMGRKLEPRTTITHASGKHPIDTRKSS